MEWPQDLLELFEDPILADVRPRAARLTANDRLVKALQNVSEWVTANQRLPQNDGPFSEKKMHRAWMALKQNAEELKPYDELHILD